MSAITTHVLDTALGRPARGVPVRLSRTAPDQVLVAGCAFTVPPGKPQRCLKVQWLQPALRVTVLGQPAILRTSVGLCQSPEQIPQGPPTVLVTQPRVSGT